MSPNFQPQLFPLFATPFATMQVPQSDVLNRDLTQFFLELKAQGAKHENPNMYNLRQDALFESNFDLFSYDHPAVQHLRKLMLGAVGWMIQQMNGYSAEQMAAIKIYADAWFHITEQGGYFLTHNHPMASWSAVYCVAPGEDVPGKPDSGLLRFHDPRPHCNSYLDAGNAQLQDPYSSQHHSFKLTAGQIVLFPSYLQHEVAPFFGSDRRITVAVNCWTDRYGS